MNISEFLENNWLILSCAGIELLFIIIFSILKKKPVVRSLDEWILHVFETFGPSLINKFEVPGNGETKKASVVNSLVGCLQKIIDLDDHSIEEARIRFGKLVEGALSCPQKK